MKMLNMVILSALIAAANLVAMTGDVKEAAEVSITASPEAAIPMAMPAEATTPVEIPMIETVDLVSTPTEEVINVEETMPEQVKPIVIPPVIPALPEEGEGNELPELSMPADETQPEAPITQ